MVCTAQETLRPTTGGWGDLSGLADIGTPPVGFVPSLTFDAYDYVLLLKDFFDACGVVVVGDSTGVVYEGVMRHPVPIADATAETGALAKSLLSAPAAHSDPDRRSTRQLPR